MAERLLVWGAGGHGRVVAEVAAALGYDVLGFIDRDVAKLGTPVGGSGLSVIATEEELLGAKRHDILWHDVHIALGIGDNAARLDCLSRLAELSLPPLIHPTACVSKSAMVGRGTVVFPHAVINADARIGEVVIVNTASVVEHDCQIEDGVHISPGAVLTGNVTVGRGSWVAASATIIPGIRIGPESIVGAGATVVRDVPGGVLAVGSPARIIKSLS